MSLKGTWQWDVQDPYSGGGTLEVDPNTAALVVCMDPATGTIVTDVIINPSYKGKPVPWFIALLLSVAEHMGDEEWVKEQISWLQAQQAVDP